MTDRQLLAIVLARFFFALLALYGLTCLLPTR